MAMEWGVEITNYQCILMTALNFQSFHYPCMRLRKFNFNKNSHFIYGVLLQMCLFSTGFCTLHNGKNTTLFYILFGVFSKGMWQLQAIFMINKISHLEVKISLFRLIIFFENISLFLKKRVLIYLGRSLKIDICPGFALFYIHFGK